MLPVNAGLFRNQAAVMTKAAMDLLGLPGGGVRGPLLPASDAERHTLREDLTAGGVKLNYLHSALPSGDLMSPKRQNEDGFGENMANGAAR
jgi:hypothetical protein